MMPQYKDYSMTAAWRDAAMRQWYDGNDAMTIERWSDDNEVMLCQDIMSALLYTIIHLTLMLYTLCKYNHDKNNGGNFTLKHPSPPSPNDINSKLGK